MKTINKVTMYKLDSYPFSVGVSYNKKTKKFSNGKAGLIQRTKIVQKFISKIKYSAPHSPKDFVVEEVSGKIERVKNIYETWHLGT